MICCLLQRTFQTNICNRNVDIKIICNKIIMSFRLNKICYLSKVPFIAVLCQSSFTFQTVKRKDT